MGVKELKRTNLDVHINTPESVYDYCQTCNISRTFVGNKIVDHSDAVGALPAGTAPTTSSLST